MSFLSFLGLGKQAGDAIATPIEAIGEIIDAVHTSGEEKEQAKAIMAKIAQRPAMVQAKINSIEASHKSAYVAGWRPFIGYVCGVGLAFAFIVNPTIQWFTGEPGPVLPLNTILELVVALLGLSGLRTYEKIKKVTR